MNGLQRAWSQFLAIWNGLSAFRRYGIMALATLAALAVGVFAYLSANGEYRVLFANLPPEESGAITAKLQSQGVPYRLEAGGTSILVPEERLAQARVSLAADGVTTKGGKGFELFDDAPLGMTPFVQKVNYTRALQAELAHSITQLEPVASARVLIAQSDPTPFVRDQRPTTASVVLKLKSGAALNRSTAAGIVALVSRSVEGLKAENVTVVDSAGRVLSDPHTGDPDGLANGPIESRRELETYLASKAEDMLARHLGPGRAIVRVSADMNLQRVKERRESYSPEDKVVASERTVTSKSGASSSSRGGAAGAAANGGRGGGAGAGGGNSQEESIQTDYLVSKSVRELEEKLGGIQRLTIAAMVDLAPTGDGSEARANVALADAQELIKQAIGFRNGRDEIKVSDVRLSASVPPADPGDDAAQAQRFQLYVSLARNLALAIAAVVTVVTLALLLWQRRPVAAPKPPAEPGVKNGHANGHATSTDRTGPVEVEQRSRDLGLFAELVQRDPDRAVQLLESLLGGVETPV